MGEPNNASDGAVGRGEFHRVADEASLMKILECPICTEIPYPPIFGCENGHAICSECRPKLRNCGLCHGRFTRIRNYALESIINSSTFKCKYAQDGCDQLLKGDTIALHFRSCEFRPVPCYEKRTTRCTGQLIPYRDYAKHLEQDHKNSGNKDDKEWFDFAEYIGSFDQDITWPLYYKYFDGLVFFKNSRVDDGCVYWWVTVMGSDEVAKKYFITVSLVCDDNRSLVPKLNWAIPIYSFRKDFQTIGKANCVVLQGDSLIPFCRLNEKHPCDKIVYKYAWSIKFTIGRM